MIGRLFCLFAVLAGVACATPGSPRGQDWPAPAEGVTTARVVRVTDGDTVVLRGIDVGELHASTGGRKTRLIGVDTPELRDCFGDVASEFTKAQLDGRDVSVGFDRDPTDRFGRALAYLWREGELFNARLAAGGFARPLRISPNVRYAELFERLAAQARRDGRGMWGSCSLDP